MLLRRVPLIVLALVAVTGPALAQDRTPAIAPAAASSPPIEPSSNITPADLDAINAQIRNDEERMTLRANAELQRENGIIVNRRVALNYNPYPHGRIPNLARIIGWRKPKQ